MTPLFLLVIFDHFLKASDTLNSFVSDLMPVFNLLLLFSPGPSLINMLKLNYPLCWELMHVNIGRAYGVCT